MAAPIYRAHQQCVVACIAFGDKREGAGDSPREHKAARSVERGNAQAVVAAAAKSDKLTARIRSQAIRRARAAIAARIHGEPAVVIVADVDELVAGVDREFFKREYDRVGREGRYAEGKEGSNKPLHRRVDAG